MPESNAISSGNPARGFKWPVSAAQRIPVQDSELWDTISMPGNLEPCHPFCKSNPVKTWPGARSRDRIHYLNGLVFERRFHRWIDGAGYDLEIGRPGGPVSHVSWRITRLGEGDCTLRITVWPHGLQDIPVAVRWLPYLLHVRPRLRHYLTSVVRGFEWFVLRGEAVPRNHWGRHPWFSEPGSGSE